MTGGPAGVATMPVAGVRNHVPVMSGALLAKVILAVSLVPLTIGENSANYLFILLLVFFPVVALSSATVRQVALSMTAICAYLWGLLFVVLFVADFGLSFLTRQLLSYGSFLVATGLIFARPPLSSRDVVAVTTAVAVTYSILSIALVAFVLGLEFADVHGLKVSLQRYLPEWPQRFPILVMFCLLAFLAGATRSALAFGICAALAACLVLTFSRAVYLSTVAGLAFLGVARMLRIGSQPDAVEAARPRRRRTRRRRLSWVVVAIAAVLLLQRADFGWADLSNVLALFRDGVTQGWLFLAGDAPQSDRLGGSEAVRLFHWKVALDVWSHSPVFGTGFAGLYLFSDLGSTHSQYVDVLLRMGLVGLVTYLWLWMVVIRWYAVADRGIAAGLVAVFVYGLFHETTKMPYVACVFFLLAAPALARRRRRGASFEESGPVPSGL